MNDAIKTQLSAFVDGELSEAEAGLLIRRLSRDPELRALVADYQSVGRIMRAEESVPGAESLLARINSELGTSVETVSELPIIETTKTKNYRPMVGVAAAAAVAVLAVFSIGQLSVESDAVIAESYTVPEAADEIYFERHGQTGSSFNTRVVTYQLQSDDLEDQTLEDQAADDGATDLDDNTEEMPTAE